MGRQNRNSLSDWWTRSDLVALSEDSDAESKAKSDCSASQSQIDHPATDPANLCFSPRKRIDDSASQPQIDHPATDPANLCFSPRKRTNFFIGDGETSDDQSRECSPRKRVALACAESNMNAATMSMFKGICADYFEKNVSPILRYIQQTQEQLLTQVKHLASVVDQKANADDVPAFHDIEQVAARVATVRADDSKVAMHARLEELAIAMNNKANVSQLAQKANTKDVATSAQLADLAATLHHKVAACDVHCVTEGLQKRLRAAEEKVAALSEELRELKRADIAGPCEGTGTSDILRVKAVFAAAGLRVDKQLKEMRQQMQKLRDESMGQDVGERWPGRRINVDSASAVSVQSDNDSDKLSLGASACPSSLLDTEEKAELRKIRAIVAAAGTAFSRDLRLVKSQMCEVRNELQGVKVHLDRHHKS